MGCWLRYELVTQDRVRTWAEPRRIRRPIVRTFGSWFPTPPCFAENEYSVTAENHNALAIAKVGDTNDYCWLSLAVVG